jgi:predicted DCC family thiol-disulfide oxidoreductase YuxK
MQQNRVTVYYDGACPKCVRDRRNYEKLSGQAGEDICWFDITGREGHLQRKFIELAIAQRNHILQIP